MIRKLNFHVAVNRDSRAATLERRDEIIDALEASGLRLSMTDDGTEVYMVDDGVKTFGERIAGHTEMASHDGYAPHSHEVRPDHKGVKREYRQ